MMKNLILWVIAAEGFVVTQIPAPACGSITNTEGWRDWECVNGVATVAACHTGYTLSGTTCTLNGATHLSNSNNACWPSGYNNAFGPLYGKTYAPSDNIASLDVQCIKSTNPNIQANEARWTCKNGLFLYKGRCVRVCPSPNGGGRDGVCYADRTHCNREVCNTQGKSGDITGLSSATAFSCGRDPQIPANTACQRCYNGYVWNSTKKKCVPQSCTPTFCATSFPNANAICQNGECTTSSCKSGYDYDINWPNRQCFPIGSATSVANVPQCTTASTCQSGDANGVWECVQMDPFSPNGKFCFKSGCQTGFTENATTGMCQ